VNRKPKIENLKPFKKGDDPRRNMKGAPKLPDLEEAMRAVLGEEKEGKTALVAILAALRAKAAKGDIRAAELLLNRGYGLPKQKVQLSSDPEQPVIFKIDPRFANDNG
jgi:hypothetical protein